MPIPTPPDECTTTCNTACSGSCSAQANVQCQLDCQAQAYTNREQQMVERCNTSCETTGGAIFCDGQFLNVANIDDCAAELAADVDIAVNLDVQAAEQVHVSAPNRANTTAADSGRSVSNCALSGAGLSAAGPTSAAGAGLPLLALAALLTARRRHQHPG
jgi:hypothetical protein